MEDQTVSVHELRALWQSLPTTPVQISPANMRLKVEGFRGYIRRRNVKEMIIWLAVCVPLCWFATWPISFLWDVSCVLLVLGCLFAAMNLHRRSGPLVRETTPTMALVDFHRAQLAHERDMLRGMWRWYLLPPLPGIALFLYAWADFAWHRVAHTTVILGATCMVLATALASLWTVVVQLSWAARLQRRIDDLDRYRES